MRRSFWLSLHRWLGLALALFLFHCGITGSLLAFRPELEAWLDPAPAVTAPPAAAVLDPMDLRERLLAARPDWRQDTVDLQPVDATRARRVLAHDATGTAQWLWQDPYRGTVLGERPAYQAWPLRRDNLMDTVYALHYHFALPGRWGAWGRILLGVAAFGWVVTAVVGLVLTWPPAMRQATQTVQGWQRWRPRWPAPQRWRQWRRAWRIQPRAPALRLTLDAHRAGSLWLWLPLLVFAWTAVGFNLPGRLYERVMGQALGYAPEALRPGRGTGPAMAPTEALAHARAAMARAAQEQGFTVTAEHEWRHDPSAHRHLYRVASSRDLNTRDGRTQLALDDHSGEPLGLWLPTGQHRATTVDHLLKSLHRARIGDGLLARAPIAFIGLFVAFLAGSGVVLWARRRRPTIVPPPNRSRSSVGAASAAIRHRS